MENPIIEESYEEAKRKAKELYFKIGGVWCLALNDCINFNKSGFRHLVWKGAFPRPKSEQKRRFALLIHIKTILRGPGAEISSEKKEGVQFWVFTERRNNKIIKVVVRQIGGGEKHFFSVFERT
jgi:hypothetical protein